MATPGRIKVKEKVNAITGTTLPVIGHVSIGEMSQPSDPSKKSFPKSLNHFRVRGEGGSTCLYESEFTKAFGDKPNRIAIAFISDDIKEVCFQQYENWENGKNWGTGDGENFRIWDIATKSYINVGADHPTVQQWKVEGKWKERLTMTFVIPKISSVLGVWKFKTGGSKSSIPEIIKAFDWIKEKAGTVKYFPFDLVVEAHVGKNPGEAKSWKIVKLIPSAGQNSIQQIRQLYSSGGLDNTGLFVLSDEDIKRIAEKAPDVSVIPPSDTPLIDAPKSIEPHTEEQAANVVEEANDMGTTGTNDELEAKPQEAVAENPLPGMEGDAPSDSATAKTVTPSLKSASKKGPGLFS